MSVAWGDRSGARENEDARITNGELARLISKAREDGERRGITRCAELLEVSVESMLGLLSEKEGGHGKAQGH